MEVILYFFRDQIKGTHYFIYAFILSIFMFAIIGYLFKQKYAKLEIKLGTETKQKSPIVDKKISKKELKEKRKQEIKPTDIVSNSLKNNETININNNSKSAVISPAVSENKTQKVEVSVNNSSLNNVVNNEVVSPLPTVNPTIVSKPTTVEVITPIKTEKKEAIKATNDTIQEVTPIVKNEPSNSEEIPEI